MNFFCVLCLKKSEERKKHKQKKTVIWAKYFVSVLFSFFAHSLQKKKICRVFVFFPKTT